MHPDEIARPGDAARQDADRQRGGVRPEYCLRADHRLELAEHARLQLGVLEDGLDHEVDVGETGQARGGMDAGQQCIAGLLGGAAGLDGSCLQPLRVALALAGGDQVHVGEDDVDPGSGGDVGDPGPHHPGADHGQPCGPERGLPAGGWRRP